MVDGWDRSVFDFAVGPMDFYAVDLGGGAEAEVEARVVVGKIAAATDDVSTLLHHPINEDLLLGTPDSTCGDVDDGSGSVARRCSAASELEFDPVVVVGVDVAEENWVAVHHVDDGVNLSVVEEITDSHAAACNDGCEASAFDGGDVLK